MRKPRSTDVSRTFRLLNHVKARGRAPEVELFRHDDEAMEITELDTHARVGFHMENEGSLVASNGAER